MVVVIGVVVLAISGGRGSGAVVLAISGGVEVGESGSVGVWCWWVGAPRGQVGVVLPLTPPKKERL